MFRNHWLFALWVPAKDSATRPARSAEPPRTALHRALRAELQQPEPDWARVAEIERALAPQGRLGDVESRIAGQRWSAAGIDLA